MDFKEDTDLEGELLIEPRKVDPSIVCEPDPHQNVINWRTDKAECKQSCFPAPESDDEL